MDEVIIDSKQDPPTTDGPILMQQDGIYHLTEGKSSVVEFKPGQSSHSQLIQDESLHNVAQVSQHHLQAAMASVTELRNESREMHLAEPDLGRLNIRQYEYLNNSLRKSLRMTTGADAINDTDSFGGAEEGETTGVSIHRKKNIQKTDQIAPLHKDGMKLMEVVPTATEESTHFLNTPARINHLNA